MTAIEKIQTVITPLNSVEKINEIIDQVNNLETGEFATTEFVLDNCYKPPLLSFMWADHLLNDMSWLRADTFSWQDGTTYSLIYNELLSEYNNSASVSETEGSITFKRTPKGYKIALATQETAIAEKYATDGIAWYYILDTTNQRFKLPRMKHKYWKDQTTIPVMGNGMTMGITDGVKNKGLTYITTYGYYSYAASNTNVPVGTTVSGSGVGFNSSTAVGLSKDSTQSGVVADVSDVNIETGFYLYFYVGGFTKSAEAQTAGLNSELFNGKVDLNFNNMNPSQTAKNTIVGWGMPDYSASVAVTMPYTAPSNGWFVASNQATSTIVKINNVQVAMGSWAAGSWSGNLNCQIMVAKGDVITGATGTMNFMPCKGAN